MPFDIMILVTNVTHTLVPTMYRCLIASLPLTHLPIASLIVIGHSHANYLSNIGGYDLIDTYPYTISLLSFLLA